MGEGKVGAIIVGTGFGVLTHLRALRKAGIEVHALVGRNPEKTRDRAQMFDVPRGLTSLAEALALPGVDAVTISTPPHTHAELVLEAIAAGKHVLCEKPFARDADEGQRMLEAAEQAGIVHLLGTEFRYATSQALLTRTVREGAIGEPRLATFIMNVPVLADPASEVPDWWSRSESGGGWLGAYASHIIDQVRATLGEISGVSASLSRVTDRDWTVEDSYTVHFRTASGCDGLLQSTCGARGPMDMITRVSGSNGTAWLQGADVLVADAAGTRTLDVPEDLRTLPPEPAPRELMETAYDHLHAAGFDLGPYTKLAETLRDRILGLETAADPAPATFADGLAAQRVLDAIRKSSAERCWVEIGE
ncbi:MAG: Gfo/Idh/MocA family oxidoreductase [bacterium]|nr:Gfo/Idh/MocA family oxidoreductase [bacterium]